MLYENSMNQQRLVAFMGQMLQTSRQKIFLILDNLRVHHGNMATEWVSRHRDTCGVDTLKKDKAALKQLYKKGYGDGVKISNYLYS